ncbi:hypothetical protein POM88_043548 [Heracleum sosnowskyi]|uniref:Protein kinase domain-containing protein n=1 Tax=Heracleum sosnowskyi TaxID=360622 RepID=A0AAD8M4A9_9APIA|nr:hypothetical protein POM88_043548 [Heracleum sosnowskyi]
MIEEGHDEEYNDGNFQRRTWKNFTYQQVFRATNGFTLDNLVGKGGYAEVYKGVLEDGQEIAVKRLTKVSNDERKGKEFLTEIGTFGHRSLATDLQNISVGLRKKHSSYLNLLRQQKEEHDGLDVEMNLNENKSRLTDDEFSDVEFLTMKRWVKLHFARPMMVIEDVVKMGVVVMPEANLDCAFDMKTFRVLDRDSKAVKISVSGDDVRRDWMRPRLFFLESYVQLFENIWAGLVSVVAAAFLHYGRSMEADL